MVEVTQPSQAVEPVPRSFRIIEELLQRIDYTKGCPKCGAMKRGDPHKTVAHSVTCRKRVENEIKQDEVLSKKLAATEERKNQFLARQIEASDRGRVEEGRVGWNGEGRKVWVVAGGYKLAAL